jgi:hypothetical protein
MKKLEHLQYKPEAPLINATSRDWQKALNLGVSRGLSAAGTKRED